MSKRKKQEEKNQVEPRAEIGLPKQKAIEVTLSNGYVVMVHEPGLDGIGMFFKTMPALHAIGKIVDAFQASEGGVQGVPFPDVPGSTMELVYPLLSVMTTITVEQYKTLPMIDSLAIMMVMIRFIPKNLGAAQAE